MMRRWSRRLTVIILVLIVCTIGIIVERQISQPVAAVLAIISIIGPIGYTVEDVVRLIKVVRWDGGGDSDVDHS